MPLPPDLRRRLAQWLRTHTQSPAPQADRAVASMAGPADAQLPAAQEPRRRCIDLRALAHLLAPRLDRVISAGEALIQLETRLTDLPTGLWPRLPGSLPEGWVIVDIETCGLRDMPVFLVGIMAPSSCTVLQLLARDHAAEPLLVAEASARLAGAECVVTYNGTSFDLPFLSSRARYWRLAEPVVKRHLDLLLHMRRQWGEALESLRLTAVEAALLGWRRIGDLPGAEIPARYTDFVRSRRPELIADVLAHNICDLIACWSVCELLEMTD